MATNRKSDCCNANVDVGGIGDFDDNDRIHTYYYVCKKCKKACDLKQIKIYEYKNT